MTKPAARRRSNVRQTRAQTAAAAAAEQAAQANLETLEGEHDVARDGSEPLMIDGDTFDCAGCDRPNKAEHYMVQCGQCECHYTEKNPLTNL